MPLTVCPFQVRTHGVYYIPRVPLSKGAMAIAVSMTTGPGPCIFMEATRLSVPINTGLQMISTDTMWTPRCGGCFFLSFHFKVGILAVAGKIVLHFCFQALQIILFIVVNRNCEISRK